MLKNKYDFTFFIQVKNCNPNGDPDMGNLPRMDEETLHGYITDAAIKRKIRDYIEAAFENVPGMDILVKDSINMNVPIAKAVKKSKENGRDKRLVVCDEFYDVRTFGGVLSTGLNAGQITGPVQFEFAQSLDPIFSKDITLTRLCYTEDCGKKEGKATPEEALTAYEKKDSTMKDSEKRTMGRKQFIPYGLYMVHGYVSAAMAQKTGFSEKDLKILFESILNMYNYSTTASKSGMTVLSPIIIFKHMGFDGSDKNPNEKSRSAILGCAPSYKLHELINIKKKDDVEFPRDYTDYEISVCLSNLPKNIQIGFKYMPYEDIIWGAPNDKWVKVS